MPFASLASFAALVAMLPALAVAAARLAAAFGAAAPVILLGSDAAVASALLAGVAVGTYAVAMLRGIARDSRELLLRARVRDQADGLPTGASVVDFAIHLDRRHEIDVADAEDSEPLPTTSRGFSATQALRDVKSRLAHIPSVRRDRPA